MGKIKQIIAQYGDTLENTYPVTLAEAVMYYKDGKLSSLKEYLDELKVEATGDYLPLPESTLDTPDYLVGVKTDNSETYKVSQIPAKFLPSYVDDVIEGTLKTFPEKGETGKIYVDTNTNLSYRWTGSAYIEIGKSTVLNDAGSATQPIYFNEGKPIASTASVGNAMRPVYLKAGVLTPITPSKYTSAHDNADIYWRGSDDDFYYTPGVSVNPKTKGIICNNVDCKTVVCDSINGSVIKTLPGSIIANQNFNYWEKILTVTFSKSWRSQNFHFYIYDTVSFANFAEVYIKLRSQGDAQTITKNIAIGGRGSVSDFCTVQKENVLEFWAKIKSGDYTNLTVSLLNITSENGGAEYDWTRLRSATKPDGAVDADSYLHYNSYQACRLITSRKLWGNDFNGTADINGTIKFAEGANGRNIWINGNGIKIIEPTTNNYAFGMELYNHDGTTAINGAIGFYGGADDNKGYVYSYIGDTYSTNNLRVWKGGNVTIGQTADSGYKLDVKGSFRCTEVKGVSFLGTDANGKLIESTSTATTSADGLMSVDDKRKLNDLFPYQMKAAHYLWANSSSTARYHKIATFDNPTEGRRYLIIAQGKSGWNNTNDGNTCLLSISKNNVNTWGATAHWFRGAGSEDPGTFYIIYKSGNAGVMDLWYDDGGKYYDSMSYTFITPEDMRSHVILPDSADKSTSIDPKTNKTFVTVLNIQHSTIMTGATASIAGKSGYIPAPAAGKQTSFLRGDGTWVIPDNTTYNIATQSVQGLMSAADKKKLDSIATGATANTGNITGVTAGNGLTGGGSSGSVTLNVGAGSGITVAADKVSVNTNYTTSGKNYKVAVDNSTGGLYVNVPWTDNNTDTKVTQSSSSSGSSYPILASASTAPNGTATTTIYNANIKMNPLAGSITATAFYQTSDINKKDIHGDINLSIEDILSIPTIEFNYKEDDKTHIGTIAQEVEKVCPEIVQTDNEGFKSVDYAKLSVLAIKALKDTHKELSSLKEEVEQIKALLHGKV